MTRPAIILAALLLAGCAGPGAAPAPVLPPCFARSEVPEQMAEQGRRLVGSGVTSAGMQREIYADTAGNWIELLTFGECTRPTQSGSGWTGIEMGEGA